MSTKYLLGIDNGGTMSKAALFTTDGRQVAVKSVPTPTLSPRPGFSERSPEEMRRLNYELLAALTAQCDGEIIAVGLTGHGKGLYVLGEDGTFPYNGIGSTDTRALDYEMRWRADGTAARAREITAQQVMACQPVALLRWMKEQQPQAYARIRHVLSCKDLMRYFLTGEICTDYTDVSGTNLLDLRTRAYNRELLELFGIPEVWDALPPIRSSGEVCGTVSRACAQATGLREGTPVCGGMFDIDACAVAMGNIHPGDLCVIAGTWSINEYVARQPAGVSMNSVFADPAYYLAEESSPCSCGNLEWVRGVLRSATYAELDEAVAGLSPEDTGVYYLPFLYASNENPRAKGSFIGLDAAHGTAQLARAVFEGVAFAHRTHIDALLRSRDTVPDKVRLAGGVVRSAVWTQMFADVIGLPMEIVAHDELGAKGAAMAAGIAAGVYADYADAAARCVHSTGMVRPDPARTAVYRRKYDNYKAIVSALDGVWDRL